jgi:hypothetical protein
MMTDDQGHFGFGGLCAGTASLRATLPGGDVLPAAAANLDGKNHVLVELGSTALGAATPGSTATPAPQEQPAAYQEPSMPETGLPGWLLVASTLFGLSLLLVIAGVWREFSYQN